MHVPSLSLANYLNFNKNRHSKRCGDLRKGCVMKNKVLAFLIICTLMFSLTGCFSANDPAQTGKPEDAETEVKNLYSSVPDELEGSYFLYSKNRGKCKALVGEVHILAVLIDDTESTWDSESAENMSGVISEAMNILESSAEEYSAELKLDGSYVRISSEVPLAWDKDSEWRDDAIKAAGYESMEKAGKLIEEEYGADESIILFCFNKSGRSYAEATAEENEIEYAVIYEHDVETYMHEMLHLFGTMDYYYPDEVKDIAEKYFSGTIMATGTKPVVDSLSAFVIGWTDEVSEDGLDFLRETAFYSLEDAEDAGENETVTGKVKDRPIRGMVDGEVCEIGLYTGDMVDGAAVGKGEIKYHNGDYCNGEFNYGVLHGEGTYIWANGDKRSGTWVNGELEGNGTDIKANGDSYTGDFVGGIYHGSGKYADAKGNVYEGQWVNGKYHGKGKYTWADGSVYNGEFTEGSLTGYGRYISANGDVVEGYFEDWSYVG